MRPLLTSETMSDIDKKTINEVGIPGLVLMENAGRGCAEIIMEELFRLGLDNEEIPVSVLSGTGNNGGDGFVIARHLRESGLDVSSFLLGKKDKVKGDAKVYLDIYERTGGEVIEIFDKSSLADFDDILQESIVIVDAIFGTGLGKKITGLQKSVIEIVNSTPAIICSVDIPSGVDATTGRIMGTAIEADLTCTFGFLKVGQITHPGAEYCGEINLIDIGIPDKALEDFRAEHFLVTGDGVSSLIPERPPGAHKGMAGKVSVIGGSTGMTGAVVMACEGALVAGSGLIYGVVPASLNHIFESKMTEALTIPVGDEVSGHFLPKMAESVLGHLGTSDAVAIGPGLSWNDDTSAFVRTVLRDIECPIVIDADGLNCLSGAGEILKSSNEDVVITPHEMEMSRLTGIDLETISENRVEVTRNYSMENGVVTLLKGYRTVISEPDGTIYINDTGNPYMATGGAGDVLTGLILSFIGQGLRPVDAAITGAYLHGLAADISIERFPNVPVAPRNLISYYPDAIQRVLGYDEEE